MNSKKKIIAGIIVCLFIGVMAVFVFPTPNAYLLKADVSGEKKTAYSLYKSTSISSKINSLEFIDQLPEGVTKYDESKARYGSPAYRLRHEGVRPAPGDDVGDRCGFAGHHLRVWFHRLLAALAPDRGERDQDRVADD